MSIALAVTLATLSTIKPSCSWDHPGVHPYTGSVTAAIDRYTDIPLQDRILLAQRIQQHDADDTVSIRRDSISGQRDYDPTIRDMHFGAAAVCSTVTRSKWAESRDEAGAVYCVKDHCILVPRICGNISRISRRATPAIALPPPQALYQPRYIGDRPLGRELGLVDAQVVETVDIVDLEPRQPAYGRWPEQPGFGTPPGGNAWDIGGAYLPPYHAAPPGGASAAAPVPEAGTWTMLLAGLGLLAALQRRAVRRARATA